MCWLHQVLRFPGNTEQQEVFGGDIDRVGPQVGSSLGHSMMSPEAMVKLGQISQFRGLEGVLQFSVGEEMRY